LEGRSDSTVRLIDDLVIGADLTDEAAILYQPSGVAASRDGTIFVADRGANNIKMFAADGTFLKTLGKEGQGPGEFAALSAITITGEFLVVRDSRSRRLSVWTLDGEHVADHAPEDRTSALSVQGLADGTVVSYSTEREEDRSGNRVIRRTTLEGEELGRLFSLPVPAPQPLLDTDAMAILQSALDSFDEPRLMLHVGGREVVYITPLHEYQVLALSPEGTGIWALRVAWQRHPWPAAQKQPMLDSFAENFEFEQPLTPDDLEWPERYTALASIQSDGAGRLFVFPSPAEGVGMEPPDEWPVDVYSPSGDFIAAGKVPYRWTYAAGDHVYGTRTDENEETVVVRYRLVVSPN